MLGLCDWLWLGGVYGVEKMLGVFLRWILYLYNKLLMKVVLKSGWLCNNIKVCCVFWFVVVLMMVKVFWLVVCCMIFVKFMKISFYCCIMIVSVMVFRVKSWIWFCWWMVCKLSVNRVLLLMWFIVIFLLRSVNLLLLIFQGMSSIFVIWWLVYWYVNWWFYWLMFVKVCLIKFVVIVLFLYCWGLNIWLWWLIKWIWWIIVKRCLFVFVKIIWFLLGSCWVIWIFVLCCFLYWKVIMWYCKVKVCCGIVVWYCLKCWKLWRFSEWWMFS